MPHALVVEKQEPDAKKSDTKAYLEMGLHALVFSMAGSGRGLMFYSVIDMPET